MIQKLYALARGSCCPDNPDSPSHQELLLPGFLYNTIIKERFADYLGSIKLQVISDLRRTPGTRVDDPKYLTKMFGKVNADIGKKMDYFLATGNLVSQTGLDLQQVSGYTIVAERLNHLRYLSHFRSVHRGAFFAELKTTTVRKLLPESWGFLCPVHTPDGSPCGLLNHLSHTCQVSMDCQGVGSYNVEHMVKLWGASAIPLLITSKEPMQRPMTIHVDGKVVGYTVLEHAIVLARKLRDGKVSGLHGLPRDLEVCLILPSIGGAWPGLFCFTGAGRFFRRVRYLGLPGEVSDFVGSLEQVYLNIACLNGDLKQNTVETDPLTRVKNQWTHVEWLPTDMLSVVANLTPFSDYNQSPRNMYQCQMGKQTMGTPAHGISVRTDNKLYRIQTPQTPIVRPLLHTYYNMDEYPQGANAVVAVISYTGYDMEDAMILNKSAHERGFGYGQIYKNEFIDLGEKQRKGEDMNVFFGLRCVSGKRLPTEQEVKVREFLDADGLPQVGVKLTNGDPFYCWVDEVKGQVKVEKYKGMEDAYVDAVGILGNDQGTSPMQKVSIKLRIPRPPIIGDKFSSRHGQKGVCSQKYPQTDMPFSETGIVPDVIINPHAFPSRMTIGMFVESLAGKTGALLGAAQDATPFLLGEGSTRGVPETSALEFFGEELVKLGYNYYGNESMYSGITGEEFKADIYIGLVYYQRLRHMVADKYQVRTTGPVHNLTQQPVKGRKRAGGIRFGEMERDSLLAHGVSFLLQDRLMNCSDYSQVCLLETLTNF
jgi:DNA-directed RNA polymerase I subunit RPA2